MKKTVLSLSALILLPAALLVSAETGSQSPAKESSTPTVVQTDTSKAKKDTVRHFTIEELAKFDGKNGNPAYVAVNDTVYDFSSVKAWQGGAHHGFNAGKDLSEQIKKSPHGKQVLHNKKIVGFLDKKSGK